MLKRLIFLVVMGLCVTVVGGQLIDKTITVYFGPTDTTGDSAMAISFRVDNALDSHMYMDTFVTGASAADSTACSWTSPVHSMILRFGAITATPTLIDTTVATGLGLVGCTAVYNTTTELGMEYSTSTAADATLEKCVDGFIAAWDAVTILADSIDAQDSVTYVKLVSRFSEHNFGARWSVQLGSSAGAPTDSLDTTSSVDPTIAIVCEGMVAAVNTAMSGVLTSVTDTNGSGVVDSFIVTSDDPGLAFTVYFGDSISDNGDTLHGQLNVTSYSGHTDTIEERDFISLVSRAGNNLYPEIISIDLSAADDTLAGFGDVDSGYLWLYTVFDDEWHLIACDTVDSLPVNLRAANAGPVADSLYKTKLAVVWRVADTVSDTVIDNITYTIDINCLLGPK